MSFTAPYAFTAPRNHGVRWGVGVTVVALHLAVAWALHGRGRVAPQPPMPTVVVARLISLSSAAPEPALVAPPAAKTAALVPKALSASQALATVAGVAMISTPPGAVDMTTAVLAVPSAPSAVQPASTATAGTTPVSPNSTVPAQRVAASLPATGTCQKPPYPELSRRREEQGTVKLGFLIGVDGRALESHIEQSSGYARLDEAARTGLSLCQFKPGTVDGKPERSWVIMPFVWRLD